MTPHLDITLIEGNPVAPSSTDLLSVTLSLGITELPEPLLEHGNSKHDTPWRILTGNHHSNKWGAICYRFELQHAYPKAFGMTDREEELLTRSEALLKDVEEHDYHPPSESLLSEHIKECYYE